MPRFSANISMLFKELEFPERFEAAAQAGFKAVEIQFPYAWDKGQLALIDEVDADNLKLQYDLFHMRIMGDDLAKTIEANLGRIGHMQIADVPDRHEPGTGEIDFPPLFDLIDRLGYKGWIGAEYIPAGKTADSLAWVKKYL